MKTKRYFCAQSKRLKSLRIHSNTNKNFYEQTLSIILHILKVYVDFFKKLRHFKYNEVCFYLFTTL